MAFALPVRAEVGFTAQTRLKAVALRSNGKNKVTALFWPDHLSEGFRALSEVLTPQTHDLNHMNITESSNKAEIISTALEFIDDKDQRIDQLEQQQVLLIALASFLLCLLLAL